MTHPDADLVARAVAGNQDALAEVLRRVQDPVYRLALRMTGRPVDAEDAAQEILIRVMTRLASFRGEAALVTWAYRIAVNHLVNLRRHRPQEQLTFDSYRQDLLDGLSAPTYTGPDSDLLAEEIRLLCTQALLRCLDRPGRATYVLGEVLGLSGQEAAWVLEISPSAYRKRLERARSQVRAALRGRCGLLDATAPCRCGKRVNYAIGKGRIGPDVPMLATHPTRGTAQAATDLSHLRNVGELLRAHPAYAAPESRTNAILALIRSGRYQALLPDNSRESS
ncbi:RNA polymerase sigma factor [Actinocrispum wychmicini]|uniref:RNA polymerase sigma factor (Sigma-70 family) n=1 Tax=Actinocrispum wychmicini TaxID=1213861 RepID=A0A4R2JC13_9PSEU|nr:RNA polymerase sigma factor [Actinocrispum wychmicini]TCO55947.1 RNA polymerase sigma factor (sigma-70 family) [Actinocrispum wychmicini]